MVSFFKGEVTGSVEIGTMPAGCKANIQTDADLDIQFWNEADNDWGAVENLVTPGGTVRCPSERAKLTVPSARVTISAANT